VELGDWGIRWSIESAPGSNDDPLLLCKAEILAGDSVSGEIARAKNTGAFSELRDSCEVAA
jgi:hypothetical protein